MINEETTKPAESNDPFNTPEVKEVVLKHRTAQLHEIYPHYTLEMRRSIVEKMGDIDAIQFVTQCMELREKEQKYQALKVKYYAENPPTVEPAPETSHDLTTRILLEKYQKH